MKRWDIKIAAPTGDFRATLEVDQTEPKPTGTMNGQGGSGPMLDLIINDTKISWATKIEKPIPMTLKFSGTIEGHSITGKVKFGMFATGSFEGKSMVPENQSA